MSFAVFREYMQQFLSLLAPALEQKVEYYAAATGRRGPEGAMLPGGRQQGGDGGMGPLGGPHVAPMTPAGEPRGRDFPAAFSTSSTAQGFPQSDGRGPYAGAVAPPRGTSYSGDYTAGYSASTSAAPSSAIPPGYSMSSVSQFAPASQSSAAARPSSSDSSRSCSDEHLRQVKAKLLGDGLPIQVYRQRPEDPGDVFVLEWKLLSISADKTGLYLNDPRGGEAFLFDISDLECMEAGDRSTLVKTIHPPPPEERVLSFKFMSGTLCSVLDSEVERRTVAMALKHLTEKMVFWS